MSDTPDVEKVVAETDTEAFTAELKVLLGKYKLMLTAQPFIATEGEHIGKILARPAIAPAPEEEKSALEG